MFVVPGQREASFAGCAGHPRLWRRV